MNYFNKMKGTTKSPPLVSLPEIIWSWIGAFLGIAAVALINDYLLEEQDLLMIIGSFGASAVLIYGAIKSPLAQPRNLIGSQKIHSLGYLYAVIPAGLGAAVMLIVALLVNNIPKNRKYPQFWL